MNPEILIKNEAENFSRRYKSGRNGPKDHIDFKDNLELELYNYDSSELRLIYLYQVHNNIQDYYDIHLETCHYPNEPEKCGINLFFLKSLLFIEQEIQRLNPEFDYKILRPEINSDLVKTNFIALKDFPESAKLYQRALDKLNEGKYERNLLDDLRLCIETLLRSILGNGKSLENQLSPLGAHLKTAGVSKEISNFFRALLDIYLKYQNEYVKHNDKVNTSEVNLIVNLSSSMINFMANLR